MASDVKARADEEEGGEADYIMNLVFGDSDESGEDECLPTTSGSSPQEMLHACRQGAGEDHNDDADRRNFAPQVCCSMNSGRRLEGLKAAQILGDDSARRSLVAGDTLSSEAWIWQGIAGVSGLCILPGFLSALEQELLVEEIEREGWFATPSQNQAMRFGNLPAWLTSLGSHVHKAILHGQKPFSPPSGLLGSPEAACTGRCLTVPDAILHREPFFDQTIANSYEPEEGILPHVDLMRFEDGIAIVSLLSDCVMTFTPAESAVSLVGAAEANGSGRGTGEAVPEREAKRKREEESGSESDLQRAEIEPLSAGASVEDEGSERVVETKAAVQSEVEKEQRCGTSEVAVSNGCGASGAFMGDGRERVREAGSLHGDGEKSGSREGQSGQEDGSDGVGKGCDRKGEGVPVLLCAGDLLFMWEDARYKWKHGISREGGKQEWDGRAVEQRKRWSITLRRLRPDVE